MSNKRPNRSSKTRQINSATAAPPAPSEQLNKGNPRRDEQILGVVLTEEITGFGYEFDNDDNGAQGRIRAELEGRIEYHREQGKLLRGGIVNDRKVIVEAILCRWNYGDHAKWIDGLIESEHRGLDRLNDHNLCRVINIKRLNDLACREAVAILKVFATKQGINAAALTMAEGEDVIDQIAVVLRSEKYPPPPASPSGETPPKLDALRFRCGPDYRDCTWNGKRYTFSTMQAACVQVLWEERDKGTLELSQQYLLEKAGSESQRLKDVFKGSDAWATMIVKGSTHGSIRLAEPT